MGDWERLTEEPGGDSQGSLGETHRGTWEKLTGEVWERLTQDPGGDSQGSLGETRRGAWERLAEPGGDSQEEPGGDAQGSLGEIHSR